MSQRSRVQHYRADSGRVVRPNAPRPSAPRTEYTLGHAGRQFRLGPVTFWVVIGSLVIMAGWSLATGTYFAFHDDVLTRLIARQKQQQFAYEDRIAELRAQVDRIASRQLLDQEQFERKLEQALRRQATLESRAARLAGAPDPMPTGSINRSRPKPIPEPHSSQAPAKASPISDTVTFAAPPAGEARQVATLNVLEVQLDSRAKRMRSVLVDLGLDGKNIPPGPSATGGPYVPLHLRRDAGSFERQLYRMNLARSAVERLSRTLNAVPVRKPIPGPTDLSSGFGVRADPFLGKPAMHTGLDFRGSTGDPVHATASGTVEIAGWNGGYGKLVEINHGNGFSTRFGHLSQIAVKAGQRVTYGQIIGYVGSTGRSTGPHMHYETRVDGEAVDPQKFLRAGIRLGSAL
jgi:murein DD-endopeptidase MepM/ murein hydrolase activator NlpD